MRLASSINSTLESFPPLTAIGTLSPSSIRLKLCKALVIFLLMRLRMAFDIGNSRFWS